MKDLGKWRRQEGFPGMCKFLGQDIRGIVRERATSLEWIHAVEVPEGPASLLYSAPKFNHL